MTNATQNMCNYTSITFYYLETSVPFWQQTERYQKQ